MWILTIEIRAGIDYTFILNIEENSTENADNVYRQL